jgi:hypothetical protein|tara:strand:+ start:772 stop:1059 length:288 start_codon:yes stop_codon:yes gene_type:complete
MKYNADIVKGWIQFQIAKPEGDTTKVQSWYKYAKSTSYWDLSQGDAMPFCRLAKIAGQRINEEYGGNDIIKLHFPGIYLHSKQKWERTGYSKITG